MLKLRDQIFTFDLQTFHYQQINYHANFLSELFPRGKFTQRLQIKRIEIIWPQKKKILSQILCK